MIHLLLCNVKSNFYPRSPCGERLHYDNYNLHCVEISIHALLAESDGGSGVGSWPRVIFLSTLSLRRATRCSQWQHLPCRFLSTLSLRRATQQFSLSCNGHSISIHALLAESDRSDFGRVLYCLHFYPRSPCGERLAVVLDDGAYMPISIHALLAESDPRRFFAKSARSYFYPRSPCGERQRHSNRDTCGSYFYPRSPCGERPKKEWGLTPKRGISIHALLAESDRKF